MRVLLFLSLLHLVFSSSIDQVQKDIESTFADSTGSTVDTAEINPFGRVISLSNGNIIEHTKSSPILVKFFTNWCGHCQKLAPVWISLASKLKNKLNVGEVNCEEFSAICNRYNVRGYPTIKLILNGNVIEFNGGRNEKELLEFAEKMTSPIVKPLEGTKVFKSRELNFVMLYKDKEILKSYQEATIKTYQGAAYYATSDEELINKLAPNSPLPSLVLVRDYGNSTIVKSLDGMDKVQIFKWISQNKKPLVQNMESHNARELLSGDDGKLLVLACVNPNDQRLLDIISTMSDASKKIRNRIESGSWKGVPVTFAWINAVEWQRYVQDYYKVTSTPKIIIVDPFNDRYYHSTKNGDSFSFNDVDSLISSTESAAKGGDGLSYTYQQGTIARFMKKFGVHAINLGNFLFSHPLVLLAAIAGPVLGMLFYILSNDQDEFRRPAPPVAQPKKTE